MNHRVAAVVQVGCCRSKPRNLQLSLRQAFRPLNFVPVDFEIRAQTCFALRSWNEDVCQIDEAGFIASRRKAKIWFNDLPAAMSIRNFKAQRMRRFMVSLTHGYVNR